MQIIILGTEWTVEKKSASEDPLLADRDGYCDDSTKSIVVREKDEACELGDFSRYQNRCMRHEIIHAFMYESGLAENMEHISIGIEETMIDWIAIQFPKIERAFSEAGCI